jgi:putative spermidine/putrescine transport system ATP-binding protein
VSLLGASGCGKTTTLRLVAGFLPPTAGTIRLGGKDLTRLPAHKRDIGLVFQNYALFPHLSVRDNVAFGLKQRGIATADRAARADAMLDRVGLAPLADRLPAALSGGQRQRVALARALVIEPPLLMFDEPLSNLDAKLRVDMRVEIRTVAARQRHHVDLCDPRSGRGVFHLGPRRDHACRADHAAGHARNAVSAPRQRLCRALRGV